MAHANGGRVDCAKRYGEGAPPVVQVVSVVTRVPKTVLRRVYVD